MSLIFETLSGTCAQLHALTHTDIETATTHTAPPIEFAVRSDQRAQRTTQSDIGGGAQRAHVYVMCPNRKALVLSTAWKDQPLNKAAIERDDLEICHRRSGGGAVYIDPDHVSWVDFWIPKTHHIYESEPSKMFLKIGSLYVDVLHNLGIDADLITLVQRSDSDTAQRKYACWAGLGWGEITLANSKILGLSQRRNRWGARIQSMLCLAGTAAKVVDYIDVAEPIKINTDHVDVLNVLNVKRCDIEHSLFSEATRVLGSTPDV